MSGGQYQGSSKAALQKVEAALQTLLHQPEGEKVKIPTSVPFTDSEDNAHTWNNATVLKYFALKLELPTAYDIIKDGEITGLDLLSMSEKYPHPALPESMHPMHKLKIYTHVDKLRAKVISRGKSTRPEDLLEWDAAHVASWLFIEQGDEMATLVALRGNWTGKTLEDIVKHHGGARGWSQLTSEQQKTLLTAITLLLERNQHNNPKEAGKQGTTSEKRKTKKKKTTALKRRHVNKHLKDDGFDDSDHHEQGETREDDEDESALPPPAYDLVAQSEAPYVFDRNSHNNHNINSNNAIKPPSLPLSVPLSSSSKKRSTSSRSKRQSHLSPVDETDLFPDSNRAYDNGEPSEPELLIVKSNKPPAQQQEQQERSQFLKKIADLQATVSYHAKEIQRLQQQTLLLQKEKDKVTLEKLHLQQNTQYFQDTLSRLQTDRDIATQELTKVVSLFATHASSQEATLKQQIHTLQEQVVNTQKDNQQQRATQKSQPLEAISPELQSLLDKVKQVEDYPLLNTLPITVSQDAGTVKTVVTKTDTNRITANNSSNNGDNKSSNQGNDSDSDLEDTVAASLPKPRSVKTSPQEDNSAMSQMLNSLTNGSLQELQHWRFCTQHLKLPKDHFVSMSLAGDTRQLLLVVVTRWVTLGRHLLRHNLQPLLFPGQKQSTANVGDASMNSKDNRKKTIESIGYMRLCGKALLQPLHRLYHWHAPPLQTKNINGNNSNTTVKSTVSDETVRVTLTVDKSKTVDSGQGDNNKTSYPLSRYGQRQQALRQCATFPDESAEAVALVFVLATLTRHLQRFQHISHSDLTNSSSSSGTKNISHDLADVSVFIQTLQQGQLPQIAISRDNLRDFIAHQLGMELTWEEFDALAQRIDKDKSGFITFAELFAVFSSIHPMVHTLSLLQSKPTVPTKTLSTSKSTAVSPEMLSLTPFVVQLLFTLFSDHVLTMSMVKAVKEQTETAEHRDGDLKTETDDKAVTLGETWLRFFTQPTHFRTSATKFKRFLQRLETLREKTMNESKSQAEILLSFSEREKQAYLKKMKSKQQYHQDLMQDQGLVSALLLEGTKHGVDFLQKVVHIVPELKKRHFQRIRSETVSSSLPSAVYSIGTVLFSASGHLHNSTSHNENAHNPHLMTALAEQLLSLVSTHFPSKHEEFTLHLAHGCNIFAQTENEENSEQDVLAGLADCLAVFWQLRYHALHYLEYPLVSTVHNIQDPSYISSKTTINAPVKEINTPAAASLLSVMERQLRLLHHSNPQLSLNLTPPVLLPTDRTTSQPTWDIARLSHTDEDFSRLFGFPVSGTCFETDVGAMPHHVYGSMCTWPRFHRTQVVIEALLADIRTSLYWDKDLLDLTSETASSQTKTTANVNSDKRPSSPLKSPMKRSAKSAAILADLQRTLHAELWGSTNTDKSKRKTTTNETDHSLGTPLQVVSEVNETFSEQRIEQMTKYLDVLNHRATRKRNILASLLSLWQSTKLSLKENHLFVSDKERALAMPVMEIVQQTRSIQNVLLRDMQKIEPTKITLLEDRIALVRKNIDEGNIVDEQGVLKAMCNEVDAIRASLLQANNDAMRLSARILQHLEPLLPVNK